MRDFYIRLVTTTAEKPALCRFLKASNRLLTVLSFVAYPVLLLFLFLQKDAHLFEAIVAPLDGFLVVTVYRFIRNRKRPYESLPIHPIIEKQTKGKSFPSRHVYSAMAIACAWLLWSGIPVVGIILILCALLLATIRVLTGVHYISDVLAGAAFAVLCSLIVYFY